MPSEGLKAAEIVRRIQEALDAEKRIYVLLTGTEVHIVMDPSKNDSWEHLIQINDGGTLMRSARLEKIVVEVHPCNQNRVEIHGWEQGRCNCQLSFLESDFLGVYDRDGYYFGEGHEIVLETYPNRERRTEAPEHHAFQSSLEAWIQ